MKLYEYILMGNTYFNDYCQLYEDESGEYQLNIFDGEASSLVTPDKIYRRYGGTLTDDVMEEFAREVNPDYEDYRGHGYEYIAKEAMQRIPCNECRMREDCQMLYDADVEAHGSGWHIIHTFNGYIRDWQKLNDLIAFDSGDPEPFFESEEDYCKAIEDRTLRWIDGFTTIWADGEY